MNKIAGLIAVLLVAAAAPAYATTAPGTCAVVYGPKAIPANPGHEALVLHMDIAPGRVANWHSHPGTEYMSIVSGSGWLETQGRSRVDLVPGHVYAIAPTVVHRAHNASASKDLLWTGFFVNKAGTHEHTVLKRGSGPWTPGCPSRV